ncbi:hypothetical protein DFP72DRAFT_872674, partial [Ephemerocybe angulata]
MRLCTPLTVLVSRWTVGRARGRSGGLVCDVEQIARSEEIVCFRGREQAVPCGGHINADTVLDYVEICGPVTEWWWRSHRRENAQSL